MIGLILQYEDEENGLGLIIYSEDCGIYEGEFKNGEPNGQGRFNFSVGEVYEGELKDGKLNGYGIIKAITNDEIEEGFFEDDKLKYGVINKKEEEKENIYLQYEVKNSDENKNLIGKIKYEEEENGKIIKETFLDPINKERIIYFDDKGKMSKISEIDRTNHNFKITVCKLNNYYKGEIHKGNKLKS